MGEHRHAVVIGGQRCGSSLLARLLAEHPDVSPAKPELPEPKFFLTSADHDEYHRRHFPDDAPLLLEKSTTYLERPDSEQRMREIPGGVRPVVILRDPVERAISNWRFSTDGGLEDLPAELALTREGEKRSYPETMSTSPFHYLRRSRYATLLGPWLDARGVDGVSLVVFEALVDDPKSVLADVQAELGLEPVAPPRLLGRVNASNDDEPVGAGVIADLREELRSEADAISKLVPDVESLWPTLSERLT